MRPKAKSNRENKKKKKLKGAVKAEEDGEAKRNKASSAFCREPYLLRPRKSIVRPKAKPKRENKEKKKLKDAVKAEELETVERYLCRPTIVPSIYPQLPSIYPQYVGDTSDDEDELPLCLLQLLGSREERNQVATSSLKNQLLDDVPAQIKQAFRTCRERRWATGVLRLNAQRVHREKSVAASDDLPSSIGSHHTGFHANLTSATTACAM